MVIVPQSVNTDNQQYDQETDILQSSPKKMDFAIKIKNIPPLLYALIFAASMLLMLGFLGPQVTSVKRGQDNLLTPPDNMPYLGKSDSSVALFAAYDPFCAGCDVFYNEVEPAIKKKYVDTGKIKFYFWPRTYSQNSHENFESMECAGEQGFYWEYRKNLIGPPRYKEIWQEYTRENYIRAAQVTGLKEAEFVSCINSGKYTERITTFEKQAKDAGLQINPSIIVGRTVLRSPQISDVATILDRALAQ